MIVKYLFLIFFLQREKMKRKKMQERVKMEHIRNLHAVSAFLKVSISVRSIFFVILVLCQMHILMRCR